MRDFSDYRNPPSDTLLWSGKKLFERKLEDFGEDVKVDGVNTRAIIMTHSNPYNENKEDRKFLCDEETEIKRGSIVDYNNAKWLVVSEVKFNKINKYTKIFKCDNMFNFYDKNHVIHQVPCVISKSVSIDNEVNKFITTVDNEFYLTVPNNSITQQIKVNDTFKVGNYSYQIKSVPDDISQKGLLIFKMKYESEPQEEYNYSIKILNGESVDIQEGDTLQLNVDVLVNNSPISPTPSLIFKSGDSVICNIDEDGLVSANSIGSCEITVSLAFDSSVSETININVIESIQENYTYKIQGSNEIVKGQSQTYVAKKYLNGVLVQDSEFTFSVIADSVPVSAYELSVVDKNTCKITAKSSVYNIVLKAEDTSNGEFVEKNIRLKNLF